MFTRVLGCLSVVIMCCYVVSRGFWLVARVLLGGCLSAQVKWCTSSAALTLGVCWEWFQRNSSYLMRYSWCLDLISRLFLLHWWVYKIVLISHRSGVSPLGPGAPPAHCSYSSRCLRLTSVAASRKSRDRRATGEALGGTSFQTSLNYKSTSLKWLFMLISPDPSS